MKGIFITIFFTLIIGSFTSVFAQSPIDDGIRHRSMELERIKRQAEQDLNAEREPGTVIDFVKIKKDFEGIQNLRDSIIEAYTRHEEIDYRKINKASGKITKMAGRLKAELFSPQKRRKKLGDYSEGKNSRKTSDRMIKDLIVDLNDAIARFVSSPMFQNLGVVNRDVMQKSLADVDSILYLSEILSVETNKFKHRNLAGSIYPK